MTERPQHDPAQTDADDDFLAPDDEFLGDDDDTDEPPGEWISATRWRTPTDGQDLEHGGERARERAREPERVYPGAQQATGDERPDPQEELEHVRSEPLSARRVVARV